MQIGLFKLVTGEEIVTKFEDNGTYFQITAPRSLVLVQTGPQEMGVRLAPWIVGDTDGTFDLYKEKIVAQTLSVSKQLENGYIEQTSRLKLAFSL